MTHNIMNGASPTPPAHDGPLFHNLESLVEDLRTLRDELYWFTSRDWTHIVRDPQVATALIRRATRAALVSEDIEGEVIQCIRQTHPSNPSMPLAIQRHDTPPDSRSEGLLTILSATAPDNPDPDDPPCVTQIPVSVDRVELYDFGRPCEHEHPLYCDHFVVSFCAAFYHQDEFIFARAHLQLLLTPTGILNWLAGVRSIPVDRGYQPLPYIPGGALFAKLGLGITQLIYAHQTELKMKLKQEHRFPADFKLSGMVIPGTVDNNGPLPLTGERQKPAWINTGL